jgi:hypothetical protein
VARIAVRGVVLLAAVACSAVVPCVAGARGLRHDPKHGFSRGTSTNWSGYAVDGTGATYASASWIQPYPTNCSAVPNSWSSPWVGIDGDTSNTVEQIGTDSDCSRGVPTYYAWWEMYPKKLATISAIKVHPGDGFTATVSYASDGFTMTLADTTTGAHFATTQSSNKVQRSSVEWIMEGPSSANLTDFNSISFTSASATIGGQTVSPGSASAEPITMATTQGISRAVPGLSGTSAFGVTWQHS